MVLSWVSGTGILVPVFNHSNIRVSVSVHQVSGGRPGEPRNVIQLAFAYLDGDGDHIDAVLEPAPVAT